MKSNNLNPKTLDHTATELLSDLDTVKGSICFPRHPPKIWCDNSHYLFT